MRNNVDFFDSADYLSDNEFDIPLTSKKVVSLMKDEYHNKVITEFVGPRSKMYSSRVNGKDYINKTKGVKMSVVRKTIEFGDYVACLYDDVTQYRAQYLFQSHLHQI